MTQIPAYSRVVVVGGGPAGSITAALLAREGVPVTLFEREKFPRYHIGESLLTSVIPVLEFLDLNQRVADHGFVKKYGGYFKVKQDAPIGYVDFAKASKYKHSYQVIRSEFDKILLDNAGEQGAKVLEETRITDVEFDGARPIAAQWEQKDGTRGRIGFDFLVDCSGLGGLLASRYLKNRQYQENFANVAVVRYWRNYEPFKESDPGVFFMEAMADSSGWAWAIPLHNGTISIGFVIHRDRYAELKRECEGDNDRVFALALTQCSELTRMLARAEATTKAEIFSDYSYVADRFAGPGYRMVGDAAGFIDPFFSTGVHLASLGGLSAAASICGVIRGEVDERTSGDFHDHCVRRAYTRLVVAVAGVYKQIRNQKEVVLHGIDQDNFQRAFDLLQPVISGNVDLNSDELPQVKVDEAMDYLGGVLLERHSFDTRNSVAKLLAKHATDDLMESGRLGAVDGYFIRMKRGKLGLEPVGRVGSILNRVTGKMVGLMLRHASTGSPEGARQR